MASNSRRRARVGLSATALLVLGLLAVVHLPFVRARVLDRARVYATQQFGIVIDAAGLDYNLLTRSIRLRNVSLVSAPGERPFLQADSARLVLDWTLFWGTLAIERLELTTPRVTVVRHADGTTNLPRQTRPESSPSPLRLGAIDIRKLTLGFEDQSAGHLVAVGPVDLALDTSPERFRPGAFGPGPFTIQFGPADRQREQTLKGTLSGRLGFDGARVSASDLIATTPEGRLLLDGWIDVIGDMPRMDVHGGLDLNLAQAGRFAGSERASLAGTIQAPFSVTGSLFEPAVALKLEGRNIQYRSLKEISLSASSTFSAGRLELQQLNLTSAFGEADASGNATFSQRSERPPSSRLVTRWRTLDVDHGLESIGLELPTAVGARTTGQLDLRLDGVDFFDPDWLAHLSADGSASFTHAESGLSPDGTVQFDLRGGRWSLKHSLRSTTARLSLAGTVNGNLRGGHVFYDSTLGGATRLQAEDLGAVTSVLQSADVGWPTPLTEKVAGILEGTLAFSGTLAQPTVEASIAGRGVQVGNLPATDLEATLNADRDRLRARSIRAQFGTASVTASGQYSWVGRLDTQFEVSATDLGGLARSLDITTPAIAGTAHLEGQAWGTPQLPEAKGRLIARGLSIHEISIGELSANLALSGSRLRVVADAPQLAVQAEGDFNTHEPLDFTARAEFDRSTISAFVPATARSQVGISEGSISGSARARGSLRDPLESSVEADLRALELRFGSTRVFLEDPTTLSLSSDRVASSQMHLRIGQQTQVRLSGSLGRAVAIDPLELHANGALSDLVDLTTFLRPGQALSADGTFDLSLRVDGTLASPTPTGTARMRGTAIRYGEAPPLTDLALDARIEQAQIVLEAIGATWQKAKLSGEGTLPLRLIVPAARPAAESGPVSRWGSAWLASLPDEPRHATLAAQLTDITSDVLLPFVSPSRLQQIQGTVTASLRAEADAFEIGRLRASGVLERASVTLAGVPLSQVVPTRIELQDGYARIGDFRWETAGNEFFVTGGANLIGLAPRLDLGVNGDLDLRILGAFASGIASGGIARTDLKVTGSLDSPVVIGSVGITAGELRVETPPLVASDLNGSIDIAENRVLKLALTGLVNGGAAKVTGSANVGGLADLRGNLAISARNVVLEYPDGFQTESNAELTLTQGAIGSTLGGRIDVLGGTYREPLLVTRELLTAIQRQGIATAPPESSWLSDLRLDVTIATVDDVRVDNNYGRLSFSANLRVLGTPQQPGVIGRFEAAPDGEIYLAGNTFRIQTLVVDLTNPRTIAPNVTFLAETRVGDVPIDIALDCRAAGPCEREVRSQVAGKTNEEAEALLFGVPSDPSAAGAQLARLLSGEILGVVGRTVGLDTLRLEAGAAAGADLFQDPTLVAGDVNPASRLTLGKRLGEHVELVYSQDLAENGFTWSTTYSAAYGTSFRGLLLDDQSRSYEFRHEPRFGRSRPARPPRSPQPTIAAVRLGGSPGFPEQELRSRLKLREGDRFESTRWQRDRDRLAELYHSRGFLEARIRARRLPAREPAPQSVGSETAPVAIVLDYTIERGAPTELEVNGLDLPDQVRQRIVQRWTSAIFDGFLERDTRLIVREYLFREGRLQARVDARILRDEARDVKKLQIEVSPGPILTRRLEFDGNAAIPSTRLYETAEALGSLTPWLDPTSFELAIERLYQQEGLLTTEVQVHEPVVQDGASVLSVSVREGEPWSVDRVTIGGGEALSASIANEALGLSTGMRYRPGQIAEGVSRLEQRFREAGFLEVRSVVETVLHAEDRQVDVHVLVEPGPRSILSDIVVEGADPTSPLVARAIELTPGQPVDPTALTETRRRLSDSGVYRSVDIDVEPVQPIEPASAAPTGADRAVRARVRLEERPRYRFRYGLALNDEVAGPESRQRRFGFASDLENRNLFGRGATAGVSLRLRRDQQVGRILLGANRFFGVPLRSNLFLARSRQRINGGSPFRTLSDVTEISVEQTFRPRRFTELRYGYGVGRNRTRIEGQDFDLRVRLARLTTSGLIDRRTNPFDPASGWFTSASFELSRPGLGSDLSFLKSFLQSFQFIKIRENVTLASAVRVGLARTFNDEELIPSERFFAGGATSVRGYREDDLGPRSILGGAEGGRASLILNEEMRFPILRRVRGVGFLDLGNVYRTVGVIDLSALQIGVGAGVRFDTPIGLIRLDLAVPANPRLFDPKWSAYFGLGHAF